MRILNINDRAICSLIRELELLFNEKLIFLHRLPQINTIDDQVHDQASWFHTEFYNNWHRFKNLYRDIVDTCLFSAHELTSDIARDISFFQAVPTFRIQPPNKKAVRGLMHKDGDYGHLDGEINYLIPLTPMVGTSSIFLEKYPNSSLFKNPSLEPGQALEFDGRNCLHGNVPNTTGLTRVSIDFRIISKVDHKINFNGQTTVSTKKSFAVGDYFIQSTELNKD